MPVYDYKCKEHGLFNELATLEDSSLPCPCPTCGELSPRVICLAPEVLDMNPAKRDAVALNERNSFEPNVSTKERRNDDDKHAKGCGCERKLSKSKLMYTAAGEKLFPSMRPWMISH